MIARGFVVSKAKPFRVGAPLAPGRVVALGIGFLVGTVIGVLGLGRLSRAQAAPLPTAGRVVPNGLGTQGDGKLFGGSADREQSDLTSVLQLVSSGRYEKALVALHRFGQRASFAPAIEESAFQEAKVLFRLGLYCSSFEKFSRILNQGPEHRRYEKSLEWLFYLSQKMPHDPRVIAKLASYRDVAVPKPELDEYRVGVSKFIFSQASQSEIEGGFG